MYDVPYRMSVINELFVAAIDFGTTYSGYAFSARNDFDSDPTKVKVYFRKNVYYIL